MANFGKSSNARLDTCHPVLQTLFRRVVSRRDCFVACGHRGEDAQTFAFQRGFSKIEWPDGKHNKTPSMAADVPPWPEKWDSEPAFLELRNVVMNVWQEMLDEGTTEGFKLRWGGDWDGDGDRTDQTFDDLPHWEIVA